jgi:GT2 family glycosyltransferase/acetyltransferase-like isoleucine patch superfamily enzyme/2-polyprenyl-3-methyl-5-hydroxy-6-metoxy-1,4-benzoquinol methylase/Flp pilus assembly protein TadD/glycosyltransferase involved in cell wall biosynthesis
MISQTSGTIVWISAFYNRTGLAGASRAFVKLLHSAGFKVRVVNFGDIQPGIDDCDINFFKSLEKTPVTPPVTAIVFHNPREDWLTIKLPEPYVRIMMTGFVGEKVPPQWVDICNRMDQVWFSSETEKSVWIASGITSEKVRLVSGFHPWQFIPIVPIRSKGQNTSHEVFRFLSIGTFSPNRRWDALIQAYLEEFKDNDRVELYLRVNYPNWHPTTGQPQRDLANLIKTLRMKTDSSAKIVIDDALGTRLDIMRLIDSSDVYASTDVSGSSPMAEAIIRRKLIIASEELNVAEGFAQQGNAIRIPSSNAERISVQGDMLNYLPQYQGVSWPRLDIPLTRQALREAYKLSSDKRQAMAKSANKHYLRFFSIERIVSRMVKAINDAWAYKAQTIALNNTDLQSKLSLINKCRQQQRASEALPLVKQVLELVPQQVDALALCGTVLLDMDDLPGAENVWRLLPWFTSLTNPAVMDFLQGLMQKGSKEMTPRHLIELAKSAQLEGAWAQAVKLFQMAIEKSVSDKSIAFLWQDLASCYSQLDDEVTAQKMLEKAYNLDPDNIEILSALAKHYLQQEKYTEASRLISLGLNQSPDNNGLLIIKGNLAIEQNDFNQAFDVFQKVGALAPDTLAIEVTLEQLAALTGKKAIPIKKSAGGRTQMEAGSTYTSKVMANEIAKYGFEIGEFTYGIPIVRWWGEKAKLKIGRYCSIAANVKIYLGGNHRHKCVTTYPFASPPMNKDWPNANNRNLPTLPATKGDVVIGHDVWIGDDAVILSGVTIGHGAVIAARSVITKDVPPYAIVAGNPYKIVNYRFSQEEIAMLLETKWWDWPQALVNQFVPSLCSENVSAFYKAYKKALSEGTDFSQGYKKDDLFTGERAMPLAPNMDQEIMREHWARYNFVAPLVAAKQVLDVACGTGYGSDLLANTAHAVTGGDISSQAVEYSQKHYRRDNLKYETMDIRKIPYPENYFDVVVSFETLEHIVEGEQFLSEIIRLLNDEGVLVVSTPLGGPVGNPHHVAYYQSGTFASYLHGFFDDVKLLFQQGDNFYEKTKSPAYAPTFTGEYALAICRKPRRRIDSLTSIIILTYNQLKHTKLCLQSIEEHTPQPHELILVDNGSTDGTLDYLQEYANLHHNVRVIANKKNLGFAAGNNQGLSVANGSYVLLLNNDTVVAEGWLARMLSVFERFSNVGIVGPVTNNISGPQQVKEATYNSLEEMHPFAKQRSSAHIGETIESFRVVGFCLLAKREVIDRIGGLDEQFGSGNFEDDDFCLRAAAAGYKARIAQDAFIHHTGSQTFKGAGINYQQSLERNWKIFKTKWKLPKNSPYGTYTVNLNTKDLSQYYISLPTSQAITPLIVNAHPSADTAVSDISGKEVRQLINQYNEFKEQSNSVVPEKSIPALIHPEYKPGLTSIIIIINKGLDYTKKCIKSIRKHTPQPHEIIFVDNGSTDGTVKWLQGQIKENKNYQLIENNENNGLAKGRNRGINLSQGEFILLLDNDVVVSYSWLSGMLECLNRQLDAGIVGPMTNRSSGLQQIDDESYRSVDYLDKFAVMLKEKYGHRRIPCRNLSGFCMLFKRTLTEKIGLFDESFDIGHLEYEDFCLRATLEEYHNYIAGDIFIHHYEDKGQPDDRNIFNKKWTLNTASPEGRKMAVLRATELADDFYAKGKIDQAVEALINCIKYAPDNHQIYYELMRFFIESKRFSEAWEVLGTMPETAKNHLKGLGYAGYAKEGLGLDDEATAYADKMLSLHESYPAALNLRGILAYKKGDKEKAADYFQRAIDADPGYGEAYTNMGVLCWGMEKKDESLLHLKKGFVLSPTLPDSSSLYYSVVSSLGAFSDAETDFREACKLYPHHKNIVFLFIDLLIQQSKFDLAMIKVEDALALFGLDDGILKAALAVREKIGPLQIEKASKKGTLSLCMIVKNEEKHLVRCLRSVRDGVDEIIVVDTGSTDKTVDIAKVFGAKLFHFPWTGNFSDARNQSLAHATGDWILVLDADEVIAARHLDELKALIRKRTPTPVSYSIDTRNYTNNTSCIGWTPKDGQYSEEAGAGWIISGKVRLLPRRKDVFFINPVHELVEDSLKNANIPIHPCKIIVHHYGKLDMEREAKKDQDYYLLGKIKYESDPTNLKYIYELAKQAHLLHKYEETVELWLKLLSLIEADHQSPGYQEIAKISYGDPLPEIYIQLASAYLLLERYEDALEAALKTIDAKVKRKEYVVIYAHCEVMVGSLEKASQVLEELAQTTPDYPPAMLLMAVIFCLEGKNENARKFFQLLRQKGVHTTSNLNKFAKQFHRNNKKDEALLILNAVVENKLNNEETAKLFEEIQKEQIG